MLIDILTRPWQLILLMVAVMLLTLQAIIINRLAGIPYPLWSPVPAGDADPQDSSSRRAWD